MKPSQTNPKIIVKTQHLQTYILTLVQTCRNTNKTHNSTLSIAITLSDKLYNITKRDTTLSNKYYPTNKYMIISNKHYYAH